MAEGEDTNLRNHLHRCERLIIEQAHALVQLVQELTTARAEAARLEQRLRELQGPRVIPPKPDNTNSTDGPADLAPGPRPPD